MLCSVVGSKSDSHLVVLGLISFQGSGFNLLSSQDFFIFPSLVLLQYFCNNSAVLPQYFCSTSKVLLQYFNSTSEVLPLYFRGTTAVLSRAVLLWYFHITSFRKSTTVVLPLYYCSSTSF